MRPLFKWFYTCYFQRRFYTFLGVVVNILVLLHYSNLCVFLHFAFSLLFLFLLAAEVNHLFESVVVLDTCTFEIVKQCKWRFSNCIFISRVLFFVTAEVVAGSAAWLGRGLSCVCAQRRESDARPSFDLTPAQVMFLISTPVNYAGCLIALAAFLCLFYVYFTTPYPLKK